MKKLICLFNIDKLGGAEKSMINTLLVLKDEFEIKSFVPCFEGDETEISLELQKNKIKTIDYAFPSILYSLSLKNLISFFFHIQICLKFFMEFKRILKGDIIWLNGLRVGLYALAFMCLGSFKGQIVWHCRDYPKQNKVLKKIMNYFNRKLNIIFVCNSYDVEKSFKSYIKNINSKVLYNQVSIERINKDRKIAKIGIVGMLAPWKGHEIPLIMGKIYKEKLQSLGIEEIQIYGDQIYHGKSNSYKEELLEYCDDFIKYKGRKKTQEIFQEIDILIHSSIKPEPFGRVILEGFLTDTIVISTGVGGAKELVNNENSLTLNKYHYFDLFKKIEKITNDSELSKQLKNNGIETYQSFELKSKKQIESIINLIN